MDHTYQFVCLPHIVCCGGAHCKAVWWCWVILAVVMECPEESHPIYGVAGIYIDSC